MKWFEKEAIKGQELLTPEQIDYLRQPSLTIFAPLNFLFRKHWDYLIVFTLLGIAGELLTITDNIGLLSAFFFLFNVLLQGCIVYFFTKHGRRLSWNRSQWKSFEAFEKSEKKWLACFYAMLGMIGFTVYKVGTAFYKEFQAGVEWEDFIWASVVILYFVSASALPFFQAWREKKRKECLSIVPETK